MRAPWRDCIRLAHEGPDIQTARFNPALRLDLQAKGRRADIEPQETQ
jgi:hypothetical protein